MKTNIAKRFAAPLAAIALAAMSQNAMADWTPSFKISRIVAHDTGHVLVYTDPGLPTGFAGCSNVAYLQVNSANANFKTLYAALMLAYSTQANVVGWVSGCNSPVYEGPLMTRADVIRP